MAQLFPQLKSLFNFDKSKSRSRFDSDLSLSYDTIFRDYVNKIVIDLLSNTLTNKTIFPTLINDRPNVLISSQGLLAW